ncbi:hypothetical protein [Lutibacter sp.]
MKQLILIIALFFAATTIQAQVPSDGAVIKKVRERYKAGNITLNGATTRKEKIKGVWHYYYWRHFTVTAKSAEGLTGKMTGAVIYEKFGNSYSFHNYATGEMSVGGMTDPDEGEIIKYLYANLQDFLGGAYGDIVGEMPKITIPSNVKYNWGSPEQVTFNVKVMYNRKVSNTEIEKAEHTYETMLFRKGTGGKWNRILADAIEGEKKVISRKQYSSSEISSMKTLHDIDAEQSASAAISNMPKVENAPTFKSDKQLFYYIHDKLMASSPQEAKAHLYKVLAKSSFESGLAVKGYVQMWLDKIIDNLGSFQSTYCQYPIIKEEQSGAISFYDKDKSKSIRYRGTEENGTWKLKEIAYYVPSQDAINRLTGKVGNCTEKPNLEVKTKVNYKIGAIVDVKFSNGTFAAEVNKKDTSFDNRYYVKLLEGGRGYWVTDDTMSPSTAKKEVSNKENSVTKEVTKAITGFKLGDHVGINTRSGVMKGTIIKATGSNYLIKLDESGYQDMWVKKAHLTKL